MTLAPSSSSRSDSFHETIADDSSRDECKDVTQYSLPLGQIDDFQVSNDDESIEVFNKLNNGTSQNTIIGSAGSKIGDDYSIIIEGQKVNVNITNLVNPQDVATEDSKEKNGQLVTQDPISLKSISTLNSLQQILKEKPTQFWLAGVLLAIMITSSTVLFFLLYKFSADATIGPSNSGHGDDLGDGIQLIHREDWLAREPLWITKLSGPLKIVRIMHTGGMFCKDYQGCASQVLGLQGWLMSQFGMPDIAYNYLIGGDGNVYAGRGPEAENEWLKNAYDIVYLGNFLGPYDQLSDKMETAGKRIIARLHDQGYLTPDYIVIAHNQTYNTLSPGDNVFKKIVKWPHYDPRPYFNSSMYR